MSNDSVLDDDTFREDYDSGPFCRHWADPTDCEQVCRCGHKCCQHTRGENCIVDGCACECFVDEVASE